jgi:hypothetical protein
MAFDHHDEIRTDFEDRARRMNDWMRYFSWGAYLRDNEHGGRI